MAARLRIAYVYRNFNCNGSIGSLYLRHAERLALDEDVTLVCSTVGRASTAAPLRFEDVEPVVRGSGRFRYAAECASFAVRSTRALRRSQHAFDVVHVEGFAALSADLVTVHAVRPAELEHYFSAVEPHAWIRRRLSPYLLQPQSAVVMAIERRLFASGPLCVAHTRGIKDDLVRWYGVPAELVEVIPYAVEIGRRAGDSSERARLRSERGVSPDRLVVLFVGDDFERKGLDIAIEGLARALGDAELWVIGGGDTKRYRGLAARLGVAERVRFLGHQPASELNAWYSACDVLVLPSRQDSWGLPVVEAMAAGRVAVASEYAGSHEAIDPGRTGYVLAEGGSANEIAALLDDPLSDPETRAAVGDRAAREAARFRYDALYGRMREVYHRAYELRRGRETARPRAAA